LPKLPKDEVEYSRGKRNAHCGPCFSDDKFYCEHYTGHPAPAVGKCEIVQGDIHPIMWCNRFERASH
jgi:hypothetical protein